MNLAEIEDIRLNLQRFVRDCVPAMPATEVYYEDRNNKESLKQIQKLYEYDSYFHNLMFNGVVRKIAEELLEDEVIPVNMQYFNKPPSIGAATPAHQDGYYFHLQPCEAVTGWLALEAVDKENGCVSYVRGSHLKTALRPHGQTGVLGFSQGITDFGNAEDRHNTRSFPGPAGTFLIHHARTIHFAGANRSATRSRQALGFIYFAKRARVDHAARESYQRKLDKQLTDSAKI